VLELGSSLLTWKSVTVEEIFVVLGVFNWNVGLLL
jgi:hypothetical protein